MITSLKDRLKPASEDPNNTNCIRIARDYGDYEVEFDACIDLLK